ncbi:MAG: hypothetical protein HZC41_08540 [Chloroflexi bacterium]|nr:hypothetical protein [Chloroflexota bacterium]
MEKSNNLQFVASVTICPSDIQKVRKHVEIAKTATDPLHSVLITPLFANPRSLMMVRDLAESGKQVYFDSGGYYVQIGRLRYEELYMPLLQAYRANPWASIFTLPDHVPTTQDDPDTVECKVHDTITYSTLFFQELPDNLKPRAMPVVQGHTVRQIDACLQAYIRLGAKQIGFGSFGTSGKKSEINVATNGSVGLAKYVIQVAHSHGMKVHVFGLGAPALVAMLKGIKADSFDSSSWLKAAGFGQVFLPFMRAYNISHNYTVSELQRGITFNQFDEWKTLTGHHCKLCEELDNLQKHKMYRAAHNLIVLAETIAMVNQGDFSRIKQIYVKGSGKYRQEFDRWLQPN